MKNKLGDLHNHLFAQLERLSDESITHEILEQELKRGKAVADVSEAIIKNARLIFEVQRFIHDEDLEIARIPAYVETRSMP